MRAVLVGLFVASGCFVASPVMTFGGGKSAKEAQAQQATELTPPVLVAVDEGWSGEVKVAKIRVYADDDFRAQNVHWQRTFAEQLAYANEVLGAMLGVRLEAEYFTWPYQDSAAALSDKLAVLAKVDPGNDVFAVVGLTGALSLVAATFDQLGVGSMPGKHIMLRGYADGSERQAFDRAFKELTPKDRDYLYMSRRRHKTTAVLLHELGHNLGVTHEALPDTIMNATYSHKASSFTPEARDTMLATTDQRLQRAPTMRVKATTTAHPTLIVRVDAAGRPSIGGNVIDEATLDELLRMSAADDRDTEVVVKAAKNAPQASVRLVLEHAKAAGLHRMAIATDDAQ